MQSPNRSPSSTKGKLSALDQQFAGLAQRVSRLDELIDPKNPESLVQASIELTSIVKDLESIKSQKSNNQNSPNALVFDVDSLLSQTTVLLEHVNAAVSQQTATASPARNSKAELSSVAKSPLTREEVSKLLLIVSKAHSIQRISTRQKGYIKDQICSRMGYLRIILQQEDIGLLMGALCTVAGEV